ncbi:MAG TPA: serine hydrolase [Ohtaekwangia sp.]|uniref:serine hydrolase domain-containing protein n=1 Tax=Ohtaekwangia sp. TaxID=2066019 RepID=UPI002F9317B4
MKQYLFFLLSVLLFGCGSSTPPPSGDYLGLLSFPNITYHIYLKSRPEKLSLINATFKAEEFPLDTIYFDKDSLHFTLKEFYSEYKGKYDPATNTIQGIWLDDDTLAHPLKFTITDPNTLPGLHPRVGRYIYRPPLEENDAIPVSTTALQHIDSNVMDSVVHHIITGKYKDIHSLLIARNDSLVVEEYFYRFHPDYVYNIQSATKSVVSALTGIALARKEIKSIDTPLCGLVSVYDSLACLPRNKTITLKQLLTMSTGIPWQEQSYDYTDPRNSASIAANEKDQIVYLLSLPRKDTTPVFAYNSLNHILMNVVLRQATGLENKKELTQRILMPLGINDVYIPEPTPMGAIGDIGLRPRDMLKFGWLYQHEGRWQQQQIVPASWVKESTTPKVYPRPHLGYGYFWWTRNFKWKNTTVSSFFAWGYGGQYIIVIPSLHVTIVMSGSHWGTDPEDQMVGIVEEILTGIE